MITLSTPVDSASIRALVQSDCLLLSGKVYTARDAAHKRFIELIDSGKKLPVNLQGQFLYYTGPTPPQPGEVIGSAGPTTSSRMDRYTPALIRAAGLRGIIGKGNRSQAVIDTLIANECVYCAATGGAGALLGRCIKQARIVCYEDLGAEAVFELEVVDFPMVVAIDVMGGNRYIEGPDKWRGKNS